MNSEGRLPELKIAAMFKEHAGRIWLGHEKGLSLIDPMDQLFFPFPHNNETSITDISRGNSGHYLLSAFYENKVFEWNPERGEYRVVWEEKDTKNVRGPTKIYA